MTDFCIPPTYSLFEYIYLKTCQGKSLDDVFFFLDYWRTGYFSTFAPLCVRSCAEQPEYVNSLPGIWKLFFGILLIHYSNRVAKLPSFYYLVGSSIGVLFAVCLLFIVLKKIYSGTSILDVFVALLLQYVFGMVARTFFYEYLYYAIAYVIVTFIISMGVIHYYVKQADGTLQINNALMDVGKYSLFTLGCFFILVSFPSPSISMVVLCVILLAPYCYSKKEIELYDHPARRRKLQTEEEYIRIGKITTEQHLAKLVENDLFKQFIIRGPVYKEDLIEEDD